MKGKSFTENRIDEMQDIEPFNRIGFIQIHIPSAPDASLFSSLYVFPWFLFHISGDFLRSPSFSKEDALKTSDLHHFSTHSA